MHVWGTCLMQAWRPLTGGRAFSPQVIHRRGCLGAQGVAAAWYLPGTKPVVAAIMPNDAVIETAQSFGQTPQCKAPGPKVVGSGTKRGKNSIRWHPSAHFQSVT